MYSYIQCQQISSYVFADIFLVPASAPRNIAVKNVSSRSVVLQWDVPLQQYWNGDITQYDTNTVFNPVPLSNLTSLLTKTSLAQARY
jgi:hypothetical protein